MTTPIIIAATARKPRRRKTGGQGAPAARNNYLAQAPKKPAGARPGNRNAWKHGGYSTQTRATRAEIALRVDTLLRTIDAALAMLGPQ